MLTVIQSLLSKEKPEDELHAIRLDAVSQDHCGYQQLFWLFTHNRQNPVDPPIIDTQGHKAKYKW